jgi:Fis family transcriptional regulator
MNKKNKTASLQQVVKESVEQSFDDMRDETPQDLYNLFLSQVEPPLIRVVLTKCRNNKSKAADMLGMNRNTLRKKMSIYGIEYLSSENSN